MKKTLAAVAFAAAAISTSHAQVAITEVVAWGNNNTPYYNADWFELTNTGAVTLNIAGWKMDDSSDAFGSGAALSGITSIAAGESVIFMETSSSSTITNFRNTYGLSASVQVGFYTGGGVGLSGEGDSVSVFDNTGARLAKVVFGDTNASAGIATLDNSAKLNNVTIATLSQIGVNGAYAAPGHPGEVGSPGLIAPVPEPATAVFGLALLGVAALSRRRTLALA